MPSFGWRKGNPTIQITRNCCFCGKQFKIWPSVLKRRNTEDLACSRKCRNKYLSRWIDDTRYRASHGYVMVMKEGVKKSCKLSDMVYEHRAVAEQILGRKLEPCEEVHHLNGKPDDDRAENLIVVKAKEHKQMRRAPSLFICEECGHHNFLIPLNGILLTNN